MKYFAAVLFVLILAVSFVSADLSPPEVSAQVGLESIKDAEINETSIRPVASDMVFDVYNITLSTPDSIGSYVVYFYVLKTQDENIISYTSNPANLYDPVRTYSADNRYNEMVAEYANQKDELICSRFLKIENLRVFNDRTVIITVG